ncbi:MAG: efflux RND transporter periplasmic adaptor subunit [Ramlibacter sp.]|nr:efflux RND transporter periplasmic adaptor subunit [Ramlibacter sp.]
MASKPVYLVVAVVGIAAASGAAWWYQHRPAAGHDAPAAAAAGAGSAGGGGAAAKPPAVEVARVEVMKLTDDAQAVGSLRSRQSVVLRPEVSGRITQINFRDGERVRKGQLLVQLDDQLPLAQVQQSQAELSIAQANHKRNQELVAQNFISQRSVDESSANLEVAQAKLALARATAARLRIVAPFDGITGIRSVNIGDYLKDGADIVNIEDMEALYVDFRLPERYQTKARRGQQAVVSVDALPGRKFTAIVQAIDPLVDANGRSVGVRGCIDNRQLQLRPGMFARVTSVFGERDRALVVPEEAIVPQGGRQFVLRLVDGPDRDSKMAQRVEVKVGIRQPGRVEIVQGLEPGDLVVTAGQQRVQKDGMAVRVVELGKPGPGASPAGPRAADGEGVRSGAPAAAAVPPMVAGAPMVAKAPAAATARPQGPNPCLAGLSGAAGGRAVSGPAHKASS